MLSSRRFCKSVNNNDVIAKATQLSWTSDPFDRILVAHASLNDDPLVTSDQMHKSETGR